MAHDTVLPMAIGLLSFLCNPIGGYCQGVCTVNFESTRGLYLMDTVWINEPYEMIAYYGCGFGNQFVGDEHLSWEPGHGWPKKSRYCLNGSWNGTNFECVRPYYKYLAVAYSLPHRREDAWLNQELVLSFYAEHKSLVSFGPEVFKANGDALTNFTITPYSDRTTEMAGYRSQLKAYFGPQDTGFYYLHDIEQYYDPSVKRFFPRDRYEYFHITAYAPIHGGWGNWSNWTECTATCGNSTHFRYHECDNPMPDYGGDFCEGAWNVTEECDVDPCPIDGNWTDWFPWGPCTTSCGGGTQTRTRNCSDPEPAWGGLPCPGPGEEDMECNTQHCPIDGEWSIWGDWSGCSVACGGGGTRQRTRYCDNPTPQYGGEACPGETAEVGSCGDETCRVDGNWADWTSWAACSVTCGFGTTIRNRSCTNPTPRAGGDECDGDDVLENFYQQLDCMDLLECPVHGGWTNWTEWSNCTVDCGGGTQWKDRSCTDPAPDFGGDDCEGNSSETRHCNTQPCGIDGVWSEWSSWATPCSATCGEGIVLRSRLCDSPPPTYGGDDCEGISQQSQTCEDQPCLHGGWTDWTQWSICSASCLGGVQARARSCTNPRPGIGGDDCPASDPFSQWTKCNQQPCPVHGRWSQWSNWTECTTSCGGGKVWRDRNCSNPAPLWGGDECRGSDRQSRRCNTLLCPVFAVTEEIRFVPFDTFINVTWSPPVDYVWPILYYSVHIIPRDVAEEAVRFTADEGYHYTIYNLTRFKTYSTKDNGTFTMRLPYLSPYSDYGLCITTKYGYTLLSQHSQLATVTTLKYAFPAPPTAVTIQLADYKVEREHKVLIRWEPNPSPIYAKPTGYRVMIRNVRTPWEQGWLALANVTEEITGYLVRNVGGVRLAEEVYSVQITAVSDGLEGSSKICPWLIDYQSVGARTMKVSSQGSTFSISSLMLIVSPMMVLII